VGTNSNLRIREVYETKCRPRLNSGSKDCILEIPAYCIVNQQEQQSVAIGIISTVLVVFDRRCTLALHVLDAFVDTQFIHFIDFSSFFVI